METTALSPSIHSDIHKVKMPTLAQDQLYLDAIAASASATGVLPEEYLQDLAATGSLSLLDQLHRIFMQADSSTGSNGQNNK